MDPSRTYDCFAVLGRNGKTPLWYWDEWSTIFPHVDDIVARSERGASSIRCSQENIGKFRAGCMTWNETGHQKWTHNSPLTEAVCKRWEFIGMEAWIPGPTICEGDALPPDLFVELNGGMGKDGDLTFLLLALAEDFKQRSDVGKVRSLLRTAGEQLKSPVFGRLQKRPWGIGDIDHFSDSIQDFYGLLNFTATFRIKRTPGVADFPWGWKSFKA